MSVEIWILIAIAIFGAVPIFILLSIKNAVESTERRMLVVVERISAVRQTIDDYNMPPAAFDNMAFEKGIATVCKEIRGLHYVISKTECRFEAPVPPLGFGFTSE